MNKKKMVALMIVCSFMAGCADSLPSPNEIFSDCSYPDWETESGEIVVLENETYSPVFVGNESMWMEVQLVTMTATHLSFTVDNNSVIFNNLTFQEGNMGYLFQEESTEYVISIPVNATSNMTNNYTILDVDKLLFNVGYAPQLGLVGVYVPDFPYDITVTYSVEYRLWDGKECL